MMQPSASAHCVIVPCMSLCQCSFVCGHHSIFYVCFTCYYGCHWKMGGEHERKREAMQHKLPLVTCRYHQNRRIKIKKNRRRQPCLWLVCCCLLPTCYFHQLFTSTIHKEHLPCGWNPMLQNTEDLSLSLYIYNLYIYYMIKSVCKTENSPLLFCILICCFLSTHSIFTKPSPLLAVMHTYLVCVCLCGCMHSCVCVCTV